MADGQYTEQITLTAADAGASAVMQAAIAKLVDIDSQLAKLISSGKAAGDSVNAGAQHAKSGLDDLQKASMEAAKSSLINADAIKKVHTAAGESGLKVFADHTRLATMGLDAMGLEAAAAGARVGGLIDVLDEAKAALPELLALGVAIGTIGTGFMFLKDAIAQAGKFDQSMTELGQTVRDQGGDWNALSQEVLAWADVQERTTQFSRTEAVDALRKLTASGMSLADAQKSVRIAEDAAAATGKNLGEVVQGLMEAEHGRTQILADLGIATRAQIKDGMTYNQVLADIEKNMGGAAAAAVNALPGALAQLHNAFETFEQDAGEKFQGVMIDIVHDLTDVVDAMDRDLMPELQKLADWATNELPAAEQEVRNLWQALSEGGDAVKAGIGWMLDHKDEVEAFFDIVIGVKAVQAFGSLRREFILAIAQGGAFGTAVETLESIFTVGLIPTLQASVAALRELATAEAIASVGVTALIAGFVYAETHWDQTVHIIGDLIDALATLVDKWGETAKWEGKVLEYVPGFHDMGTALIGVGDAAEHAAQGMRDYAQARNDALNAASPSDLSQRLALDEKIIAHPNVDYAPGQMTVAQARADLAKSIAEMRRRAGLDHPSNGASTKTGVQGMVGGGAGSGSGYAPQDVQAQSQDTTALAAAHKALASAVASSRAALQSEKLTVDQSLDSVKAKTLAEEQLYNAYVKAKAEIPQLVNDVRSETTEEHAAQQAAQLKYQTYQQSVTALKTLEQSLKGKNKLTADEKQELENAKKAVEDSKRAYEQADTSLKNVTHSLDDHKKKLDAATTATKNFIAAQDRIIQSYNDTIEKAQQEYADTVATAGASLQQEIDYYTQRYELAHAANELFYAEHHAWNEKLSQDDADLYQKVLQLQGQEIQQHLNDVKQAQQREEQYVSTFLDDILVQHKSFKDAFKSIWDDIVKIFIADIAKMIAESALFKNVFGNLIPGSGGSFNPLSLLSLAGGSSASSAAIGTGLSGGSAAVLSDLTGAPGTVASNALHVNIAGASPNLMSMFVNSGGGLTMGGALMVGAGAFGVGSAIGNLESGGGPGNTHGIWGGLGSLAGLAGVAALSAGPLLGTGLAGGLPGLLAMGPAGWGIIAGGVLLGGLVGGAFGHKDNPALMPDKYNTQAWGQFLADFGADNAGNTSTYGETHNQIANGQSFNIGSSVSTATGGKGIGQFLHDYVTSHSQADLQKMFGSDAQAIISMFSGWDQRGMHDGKNGNMMIGNSTFNWQQIQSLGSEAFNDITSSGASGGGTSSAPVFTLNRLYPDYNLATVKDANGNTVIGGPGGSTTQPVASAPPGDGGSGGGGYIGGVGRVGKPERPIHLHNDFRGAQFIGPGGLEEVAQELATALHRLSDGQLAGSYTSTVTSRNRGGDWGPQ